MMQSVKITTIAGFGRAEFRALGTGAVVVTTKPQRTAAAALEVCNELAAIDAACSRFRSDSELESANRSAGHLMAIGPLLAEAVGAALRAAELTDGAVDPTVGIAMTVNGYDRDFSEVHPSGPSAKPLPAGGWQRVRLDRRWGLLQVPAGVALDLGATAKALAADRSAARVHDAIGAGVLVSLGGDIAVAGPVPAGGWNIRVTDWHASSTTAPGQTVRIDHGGLATSTTTICGWDCGTTPMHHIVDPGSGRPADVVWRTVSVHAGSCVDANTAATACIVKGQAAPDWLSLQQLAGRLVRPDGTVLLVAGWPEEVRAA